MLYCCFSSFLAWKVRGKLFHLEFVLNWCRAAWFMANTARSCWLISHFCLRVQIAGQCAWLMLTWLSDHYASFRTSISASCVRSLCRPRPMEPTTLHFPHHTRHSIFHFIHLQLLKLHHFIPLIFTSWNELLLYLISVARRYHIILAPSIAYRLIQCWQVTRIRLVEMHPSHHYLLLWSHLQRRLWPGFNLLLVCTSYFLHESYKALPAPFIRHHRLIKMMVSTTFWALSLSLPVKTNRRFLHGPRLSFHHRCFFRLQNGFVLLHSKVLYALTHFLIVVWFIMFRCLHISILLTSILFVFDQEHINELLLALVQAYYASVAAISRLCRRKLVFGVIHFVYI